MLDSFGDVFITFAPDWRIIHFNRAAAAHFGLRREDATGRVAWSLPGLRDDTSLRDFLQRALETDEAIDAEGPSELQPGRWYYFRAFPLQDALGFSARDVTERYELVRRHREQAERLEFALDTAGFGEWSWDAASDRIALSKRAAAVFGTRAGPAGTWAGLQDLIAPEDRERALAARQEVIDGGGVRELEFRFIRRSKPAAVWIMVRAAGQYADDGTLVGLQGVLTEITEAKAEADRIRADRARLAESEARFRAMADSAPTPIWVLDATGALEFVNRAFTEMSGRPIETLSGDGWLDLLHPEDRIGVDAARADTRRGSRHNIWEARFKVATGEYRWLRTRSRARFDQSGVFQGFVGLATDITEARKAEKQQVLLINELNHRVKNTLATIQSLARQTLRDGVRMSDARERLTDRLLALSAAHNVLTSENWESADLGQIAREAVRPYDDPARSRIEIEGIAARVAPNVALALSMALHELATNAVKYGALSVQGGQVRLAWSRDPVNGSVSIEWREAGGPPVIAPTSTGFGSRLLSGLAGELGAPANIAYEPAGLICRLTAPAT